MLLGLDAGLVEQTVHSCLLSKPPVPCSFHCQMRVAWVSTGRSGLCLLDQPLELFSVPVEPSLSFLSLVNCLSWRHGTRCHPAFPHVVVRCARRYCPSGQVDHGYTGKNDYSLD